MTGQGFIYRVGAVVALLLMASACATQAEPTTHAGGSPGASQAGTAAGGAAGAAAAAAPASLAITSPVPSVPSVAAALPTDASPLGADEALQGAATQPQPAPLLADLVNGDGTPFDLASFAGKPVLVFFGYTHCPDICPTTIGEMFGVFTLQPDAQAVFVSVDPERDTPAFLAKWTKFMPPNFHALTGSPGAIQRAADAWGVKYARVETGSKEGYTMSHTANVYLVDGDGQWLRTYPFGTPAAEMAADIASLQAD